jgi:hypothetical protein
MKLKKKKNKESEVPPKKKEGIEGRIIPVSEVVTKQSALFYGRSGTGKTTLACTFPKPLLLVDINDRGTDSVSNVEGVDVIQAVNWDDLEQIYWYLQRGSKYKTVVLDTITQMQIFGITKIKLESKGDLDATMSRPMWGEVSGLMKNLLVMFRELPLTFVMTAQDRVNVSDDEEDIYKDELDPEVGPAVMPSIASLVNPSVNILGNTYIKEVVKQKEGKLLRRMEWRLRLGPHPYYITKIRSNKEIIIPSSIKDPTYKKIKIILKGEKTNEKA